MDVRRTSGDDGIVSSWTTLGRGVVSLLPGRSKDGGVTPSINAVPAVSAENLGWRAGLPAFVDVENVDVPHIIAVGGGKGGVGKSLVSANLAAKLSQLGNKVLVVDLDLGGANLHTHFGLGTPPYSLADVILYKTKSFSQVILPSSIEDVQIVAGGREEAWGGASYFDKTTVASVLNAAFNAKTDLGVDYVILDLGAGTYRHTIDFFTAAHLGIATVLPEPTSIENAYLFLKMVLFRIMENVAERHDMLDEAAELRNIMVSAENSKNKVAVQQGGYLERIRKASSLYPKLVNHHFSALRGRTIGMVVNQIRSQRDIDIGRSMEVIGARYFGYQTKFLGYLNYDDAAWKSLRNRRLLTTDFPQSVLSRRLGDVALKVVENFENHTEKRAGTT